MDQAKPHEAVDSSAIAAALKTPPAGTTKHRVLAGKYSLEREIARGSMGRVFLANQIALNRKVAVKVMTTRFGQNVDLRFLQEARAVAALSHRNIVTLHEYGQTKNNLFYMAMEFLDGRTLGVELKEGPFAPERACRITIEIALALRHAHRAGIIHRDLKPGNVILLSDEVEGEQIKVLDFGIAKVFESLVQSDTPLTQEGLMLGTPRYMAPEQIDGSPIVASTDLYSLGVLFFQMLTGKLPFEGECDVETLHQQLKSAPPLITSMPGCEHLPIAFNDFFHKCVAREARDRFQSAQELVVSLRRVQLESGFGTQSTLPSIAETSSWQAPRFGEEGEIVEGAHELPSHALRHEEIPSTPPTGVPQPAALPQDASSELAPPVSPQPSSKMAAMIVPLLALGMFIALSGVGFLFFQNTRSPEPSAKVQTKIGVVTEPSGLAIVDVQSGEHLGTTPALISVDDKRLVRFEFNGIKSPAHTLSAAKRELRVDVSSVFEPPKKEVVVAAPRVDVDAKPYLSKRVRVFNSANMRKQFRVVESQLTTRAKIKNVAGVTQKLSLSLKKTLSAKKPKSIYPRAIYWFVVDGVSAGDELDAIASGLVKAHQSGALRRSSKR